MDKHLTNRILRQFVAALVSSGLTVEEIENFRYLASQDRQLLDQVLDACRSSLEVISGSMSLAGGAKRSSDKVDGHRHLKEVFELIDRGVVSRDRVIEIIYKMRMLDLSISTMKKMSIGVLLDRALSGMSKSDVRSFISVLTADGIEDLYLTGIEKKRGT